MNREQPSRLKRDERFQQYYAQYLQPLERAFEFLRVESVKERNRRLAAALLVWLAALGGIGYMAWPIGETWPFLAFFGFATLIGLGVWVWLPAGAHELRLQDQVLSRIVPFFGNLRYQSEPDFTPERYHDWMVLPRFSKTSSEDQIQGSYHGVRLNLAEVRLDYTYQTRDSSSTATAFKGLMIDFGLAQEYPGVTLIRSEGSDMNGRFRMDEALVQVGGGSGFEVYATKDAPGTALADTGFLERLARISAQFEAKQLFASFRADRLVMLIDKKGDYFEMSHRQITDFARDAERVREELGRLFAIVDLLELPGSSEEDLGEPEPPPVPEFSTTKEGDPYNIGGWGCLYTFILFIAAILVYLRVLDPELSPEALLRWSALGGTLMALGLFQIARGVKKRSFWGGIFALILLAGAVAVLYYFGPPEIRTFIQSWIGGASPSW